MCEGHLIEREREGGGGCVCGGDLIKGGFDSIEIHAQDFSSLRTNE